MNTQEGKKKGTTLTTRMRETAASMKSLDHMNAPYDMKEQVIRAKMVPKGLYGCETAPINEAAILKLSSTIANALTYTTKRRSVDLTFAIASGKTDLDPDVEVYARRVVLMRRVIGGDKDMKRMADEIMQEYARKGESGIYKGDRQLSEKVVGGSPTTPQRSNLRKQCNPQGPVGVLLETIHLQASTLDKDYSIKQWNQPNIHILQSPYQHLKPLIRRAAKRNRTTAAEDTRAEHMNLKEIDTFASKADSKKALEGIPKFAQRSQNRLNVDQNGGVLGRPRR